MSTDKKIQDVYRILDRLYFRDFKDVRIDEPDFDYYYAESTLYVIRHRKTKAYYFVCADKPANALLKVKNGVI